MLWTTVRSPYQNSYPTRSVVGKGHGPERYYRARGPATAAVLGAMTPQTPVGVSTGGGACLNAEMVDVDHSVSTVVASSAGYPAAAIATRLNAIAAPLARCWKGLSVSPRSAALERGPSRVSR